jgi:hypothetical protein
VSDIEQITKERGSKYGPFVLNALVAQAIKAAMRGEIYLAGVSPEQMKRVNSLWNMLPVDVREALDLDAIKTARIITGNPNHLDNWADKQGYAKIVADRIRAGLGQPGTIENVPPGWRVLPGDFTQFVKDDTGAVFTGSLRGLNEYLNKGGVS